MRSVDRAPVVESGAERQTVLCEVFLDLLEGLPTEVRPLEQLPFLLLNEIADEQNVRTGQSVHRTSREKLVPVRDALLEDWVLLGRSGLGGDFDFGYRSLVEDSFLAEGGSEISQSPRFDSADRFLASFELDSDRAERRRFTADPAPPAQHIRVLVRQSPECRVDHFFRDVLELPCLVVKGSTQKPLISFLHGLLPLSFSRLCSFF